MEIKGQIIEIFDEVEISDKFKKREFVVRTNESYPQDLLLQLVNNKTILLDKLGIGTFVTAHLNLRGRAWTNKEGVTKYFNTIEAWKIDTNDNFSSVNNHSSESTQTKEKSEDALTDSLPF